MIFFIIFFFSLLMSFYFSGTEAGFLSLNREKFNSDVNLRNRNALRIKKYIDNVGLVLALTLLGNNLFNIIVVVSFDKVWESVYNKNWQYFLIVNTLILLVLGEILPKIIFRKWSQILLYRLGAIIVFFHSIFGPIINLIMKITFFFLGSRFHQNRQKLSKEDFLYLIENELNHGIVKESEKRIVKNISQFSSLNVDQLVVPLIELLLVAQNQNLRDFHENIIKEKIDHLFVYEKRIDNLVGYTSNVDIFGSNKKDVLAKDLIKSCVYVSESISMEKVYNLVIEKGNEIIIVVNEQGGSLGVIKRSDVINKIFGFKKNNIKQKINSLIQKNNNVYKIDATIDIDDFNQYFNCQIKKKKFHTLAGFLNSLSESIPFREQIIQFKNFNFKILKGSKTSISEVELKIHK